MEDFVTLWVPLVDIDAECGGVRVFEGTHDVDEIVGETEGFWLKPTAVAGARAVDCHMRAGDALLLSKTILHESIANTSNKTRYSIDYRFFGDRTESSKHYLDVATRRVVPPQTA